MPLANPRTSHFQMYADAKKGEICKGDSGGPVMWKNKEGRYILLGTLVSTGNSQHCLQDNPTTGTIGYSVNKVSHFLIKILNFMSRDRSQSTCMHEDCNPNNYGGVKTTYILHTHARNGTVLHKQLATPCQYVEELDYNKFVCPVDLPATRFKQLQLTRDGKKTVFKGNSWRHCSFCTKDHSSNIDPMDWSDSHYLDEITAGSLLLTQYGGLESPYAELIYILPKRSSYNPYHETCQIDGRNGHIRCPVYQGTGFLGHKCIFPENVCDGKNDCEGGWDESPHLCAGKCDYWFQHQHPNLAFPSLKNEEIKKVSTSTAKDCQEECKDNKDCKKYNWWGLGIKDKIENQCELMKDLMVTDMFGVTTTNKERHVTRGPAECPMLSGNGGRKCTATNGIPYRDGIFLIQAYNGKFLAAKPMEYFVEVKVMPLTYKSVTRRDWAVSPQNEILNANQGEWFFKFTKKGGLDDSYFEIHSGYGNDHFYAPQYLSVRTDKINITAEQKSDSSLHLQKWYMEPIRPDRGLNEVRIYAKDAQSRRWYLTLPDITSNDREYRYSGYVHTISDFATDGTRPIQIQGKKDAWDAEEWQVTKNSDLHRELNNQVFRIFECDYELEKGITERGLSRRKYEYVNLKNIINSDKAYLSKDSILKDIFGVSEALYEQSIVEDSLELLVDLVDKVMNESDNLHDYAGRMKMHPVEFRKMSDTWRQYAAARKRKNECHTDNLCLFVDRRMRTPFHSLRDL